MPWTPSIPPAHNAGSNYDDYFPWDGLRFALVKLDNFTLQIENPTWGCPLNVQNPGFVDMWPGCTGGNLGYSPAPCGTGHIGHNWRASVAGAPCTNTNLGQQTGGNLGKACIPYNFATPGSSATDCTPTNGFLTMADCIRGEPTGSGSYTFLFSPHCYACNPSACSSTCTCAGGQGGWYAYCDGMGLPSQTYYSGAHINYTHSLMANAGKGAYNDTKWYHEISGRDGAGGVGYNNGSFYSVGFTMWDIADDEGFVPDSLSATSNLMHQAEVYYDTNHSTYYAIILFPCYASDTGYDVLNNQFEFKLHQDHESIGWQKILGVNWSYASTSAYDTLPPEYSIIDPYDVGRVGVEMGASNSPSATAQHQHGIAINDSEIQSMFGGIRDGEFVSLDDDWWDDGGGPTNNPWGVQILNQIQKHMIVKAVYDKYDPNLTPDYAAKFSTILVTKTPAQSTTWNYFDAGVFGTQKLDEVTDNLYFNLHITNLNDSITVVLNDVATGIQDARYGGVVDEQGLGTSVAGFGRHRGILGMNIASELVQDYHSQIFNKSSIDWANVQTHTLQTVGFDVEIANTSGSSDPFEATTPLIHSTSTTGVCRGSFYDFDGSTRLKPNNDNRVREFRFFNAVDGSDDVPQLPLSYHPLAAGNDAGAGELATGSGWTDGSYQLNYIGLRGRLVSNNWEFFVGSAPPSYNNLDVISSNQYVLFSTGAYQWPSTQQTFSSWWGNTVFFGIYPLLTHDSNESNNRWAVATGNGLIYHSNIYNCPTITIMTSDADCALGDGEIGIQITNSNSATVILDITVTDSGGIVIYTNSSYSATVGTSVLIIPAPVETYTIIITDPTCGIIYGSPTVDVDFQTDFTYDLTNVVQTGTLPACSGPYNSINTADWLATFTAANTVGADPLSGDIQFTVWQDVGGTWTWHEQGVPFQNANTNGSAYGVAGGSGCPGLTTIGTCTNKDFESDNSSAAFYPGGNYKLCLHTGTSTTSSTNYLTWIDICYDCIDFTLACTGLTCSVSCTGGDLPNCNLADGEDNYSDACNALTGGNGYLGGTVQPSNTATITGTVSGGLSPFDYDWAGPGAFTSQTLNTTSTTDIITCVAPGVYTLLTTDAAGQTCTATVTATQPTAMSWTTVPVATSPGCSGGTGSIDSAVADPGGCTIGTTIQYALSISNQELWDTISPGSELWEVEGLTTNTPAVWQASSTFGAVAPGVYYLWARSQCGCAIVSASLTITAAIPIGAAAVVTNPGCTGGVASITITNSGGAAPLSYVWTTVGTLDPLFVAPATTSAVFTQILPGGSYDYEIVVTDANFCTETVTASTIAGAPMAVTAAVSNIGCAGGSTGAIDTTVTGGTGPYTYAWTGPGVAATAADQTGLAAGTYTVVVTDSTAVTPCTTTDTYIITILGTTETFLDLNHYEYNTLYDWTITGTLSDDNFYGLYGGPTCPTDCDGTIRIILDSSTPSASYPYTVTISNDGVNYYPARNNAGVALVVTGPLDIYDTSTQILTSTGLVYDHDTVALNPSIYYYQLTGAGGTAPDEWDPGGGYVDLPFCEGSSWWIKLTETGTACESILQTTILNSDHQNVDVGGNVATIATQPLCCGCSSYGASGINVCNGDIDITPTMGTYENQVRDVVYTYLWTYANTPPGTNANTAWVNQTTQDLTAEWPGTYTILVTDSCSATDTEDILLNDPVVYIDDITWVPPQCTDCCDGELTITAHGGNGSLEASLDNGTTFTAITSPHTFTNLCDGISSIWVRDTSFCITEYFADPDDSSFLANYGDSCHANVNKTAILTTSGTWLPTTTNPWGESSPTEIQLVAVSNFDAANACVWTHNIIPGDTNGHITLDLIGGNPPYEITIVAQVGPVYDPSTGLLPCAGIGPLTTGTPDPCTLTGDLISLHPMGLSGSSVMTYEENSNGTNIPVNVTIPITSSSTHFDFRQVSVSRDLGFGALGAEYIFYVRDSSGCYQLGHVGMDNGIFNLISIYGAIDCDCICPIGYFYDSDPNSPTYDLCVSNVFTPICSNGTVGYWTLSKNLYPGQIVPSTWQQNGAALYGPYDGVNVNYGVPLAISLQELPLEKDITVLPTTPYHIYTNTNASLNPGSISIGADLAQWSTTGSTTALNTRVSDIAIWLNQASPCPPPNPCPPSGEWIGVLTEISYNNPVEAIIGMCSNEKMRMTIDGIPYIIMDGDDTLPLSVNSNYEYLNLFPLILPPGLHTIAFEVYNTSGDGFMAFEIYSSTLASGNLFVSDAPLNSFTLADIQTNVLMDAAPTPKPLSSKSYDGEEIQLGSGSYGFSCCGSPPVINMDTFCDSIYNTWVLQGSNFWSAVGLYYPGQVVAHLDPAFGTINYFMASAQSGIITGATAGSPTVYPAPIAPNVCCYGAGCTCPVGQMSTYYWEGCEIIPGTTSSNTVPSIYNGQMFCIVDVTAPCEVPLDCGRCVDEDGNPAPAWTEKGPCEDADDGAPIPVSLNNEWLTDDSELSDLVECPGTLANIAYHKIEGALASNVLDIRCIWLTIMIKHLLHNLNICITLEDIQDVFTGFLDDVCPTCEIKEALTPAQMEALLETFILNNNSNFDF